MEKNGIHIIDLKKTQARINNPEAILKWFRRREKRIVCRNKKAG